MTDQASRPRKFTVIQGGADAAPTATKTPTFPRLQRPTCPPLAEVRAWLDRYGVPYAVHNRGAQVRITEIRLSYFVHTGTLYFDGENGGRAVKGFAALVAALAPHMGPQGRRRSTMRTHRTRPLSVTGPPVAVALVGKIGTVQSAVGHLRILSLLGLGRSPDASTATAVAYAVSVDAGSGTT